MVARHPDDWEQLTHWANPDDACTGMEWLIQERERLLPNHEALVIQWSEDGKVALFSAGLLPSAAPTNARVQGARAYQDLDAEIPDAVPYPTTRNAVRGCVRAYRLGYLAGMQGLSTLACPYGHRLRSGTRSGLLYHLRAAWMSGHVDGELASERQARTN